MAGTMGSGMVEYHPDRPILHFGNVDSRPEKPTELPLIIVSKKG